MVHVQTTTEPDREVRPRFAEELAAGQPTCAAAAQAVHFGEAACAGASWDGRLDHALACAEAAQALYAERVA